MSQYIQGKLDNFCGIYSLVNAVATIAKLDHDDSTALFDRAAEYVEKRQGLYKALTWGIASHVMSGLLKDIGAEYGVGAKMPYRKASGTGLAEFWSGMRAHLADQPSNMILLGLGGKYEHWTVVRAATARSLALLDSIPIVRLNRAYCTTAEPYGVRVHRLCPTITFFIMRRS